MSRQAQRLHELLEPGANALGFEILAVELAGGDGQTVLRVFIDGPEGVGVDDCARVSRQFGAALDVEDLLAGNYVLEVSSPGSDRPLGKRQHFIDQVGYRIKIRMASVELGRRRYTGTLISVNGGDIVIEVDGVEHKLALLEIDKARLVSKQA